MATINLNVRGASGSLDGFGRLTALSDIRLAHNNFSGTFGEVARGAVAWAAGGGETHGGPPDTSC